MNNTVLSKLSPAAAARARNNHHNNKSLVSFLRQLTLLAFVAQGPAMQQSIDIFRLPVPQQ